jgi:hypothetical protein
MADHPEAVDIITWTGKEKCMDSEPLSNVVFVSPRFKLTFFVI